MLRNWMIVVVVSPFFPSGAIIREIIMNKMPEIIKEVGFDFSWSEEKVWSLDLPVETMNVSELDWHFDIPFWNTPNGYYDLKPRDVINYPEKYKEEYERTLKSDLTYPLDIMLWKGKWLLLDGLHRLVKIAVQGKTLVQVRKVPKEMIPKILKETI